MKKVLLFTATWIISTTCSWSLLQAQVTFSRFDFDTAPYTTATIGPNATSIDPDMVSDGNAAYIDANCGGLKGIDLVIPNTAGIFDQAEMGMTFRFLKMETRSDFFVRGGTRFYQSGSDLYIAYRTGDGLGGSIDYGPYNTGFTLAEDGIFHIYTFIYTKADGVGTVTVDGNLVWSQDGPDNRDLYWVGDPDPVVGTVMDGNCNGQGFLDYAYFFIPIAPLPIEFEEFEAVGVNADVQLDWTVRHAATGRPFSIERSSDGFHFEATGQVMPAATEESQAYTFTDKAPGQGTFYYRIRQEDIDGSATATEVQTVTLQGSADLQAWPNPLIGNVLYVQPAFLPSDATITLFDMKGNVRQQFHTASGAITTVDVSALPQGIYLLQCAGGDRPIVQKIIRQ